MDLSFGSFRQTPTQQLRRQHESQLSSGQFTPVDLKKVLNNPKTPIIRSSYDERVANHQDDGESLSPIPVTQLLRNMNNGSQNKDNVAQDITDTSIISDYPRDVDNDPFLGSQSSSKKKDDLNVPPSILKKHPELNSAINIQGKLNAVKGAKVLFSPKKQVYSTTLPFDQSYLPKNHHTKSESNRSFKYRIRSPYVSHEEYLTNSSSNEEPERSETHEQSLNNEPIYAINNNIIGMARMITDPSIPYVLSLYLQLFFNLVLVSIMLYFVYIFISTVKADVSNKVESYASDVLQEISMCSREYLRNNCSPGKRVPALEQSCLYWEKCMNQDPAAIGRSKITAETFAEIINGFIKPISWKSIIFLFLITIGSLVFTNIAFGSYRNSSHQTDQRPPPAPPSPQRSQVSVNTSFSEKSFLHLPPPNSSKTELSFINSTPIGSYTASNKYDSPIITVSEGTPLSYRSGSPSAAARLRKQRL